MPIVTRTPGDAPLPEIAEAIARGGWRTNCPPRHRDKIRVRISRAARRAGLPYRTFYDEDRWSLVAYLPIQGGEDVGPGAAYEADQLDAVRELARHARTHIAKLKAEHR